MDIMSLDERVHEQCLGWWRLGEDDGDENMCIK
jgi:hypothetical protein